MEEILAREKVISSNEYIVGSVPTVFYIPDYITAAEETQLLNNIYEAPIFKWKSLKNRRLKNWGGVVHEKGLLAQDLPPWLKKFTCRIYEESKLFLSPINHVLINEYLPDQGIMAHQDGPAYVPVVAILSLGSPVVMEFAPHSRFENAGNSNGDTVSDERLREDLPFSVALMPRSLLIFKDEAYSDYLHGIKDCVDQRYNEVRY
ncbi:Alpha-ketoglutarate-dependent dioxygenase alkB 6 [Orobanche gracilis]